MIINDSLISKSEKVLFGLKELYFSSGYSSYKMSKFEEYDLYAKNKEFLVSDNVITFTEPGGRLMALKPDVTLSIIKNSKDLPSATSKVFYSENVYRAEGGESFKEIMQAGVECFGAVGQNELLEVILLAAKSLSKITDGFILDISNLDVPAKVIEALEISRSDKARLYHSIGEKNLHEIAAICKELGISCDTEENLKKLASLHGKIANVLPTVKETLGNDFPQFISVLDKLACSEFANNIRIDFSVISDTNYYNGIVFKGFVGGIPSAVLSGGQYDKLMKKLKRNSKAIGFAVYLDALQRLDEKAESADGFVNIALPKGRLGEKVYEMFAKAGYECPSILEQGRKLIFENKEKKVRYFWVKPSDVAQYVERGAADIGVAGKDILLEYKPDIYELLDLRVGKCRMAVAAPKDFSDDASKTLVVATKFSNIAKNYYQSKGRDIDIIHLNGSIEIAPILALSDVIVDIVETGTTLKENDLEVFETVIPISARLISNKVSFEFKSKVIEDIVRSIGETLRGEEND